MTYYMIYLNKELHVVPVRKNEQIVFLQLYGRQILASGKTIHETLKEFDSLPLVFERIEGINKHH